MNGVEGGDVTRASFEPFHHYTGVRAQQGRVQLDADWNEQLDIGAHHDRVAALDTIGVDGAPKLDGGFLLDASPDDTDLILTPGRMWVSGTTCELDAADTAVTISGAQAAVATLVLDGAELSVGEWVEVFVPAGSSDLARITAVDSATLSLTLAPAPAGLPAQARLRRRASYTSQPDLPAPALTSPPTGASPRVLALSDGVYLAYLDVWTRTVTALDRPDIAEVALGAPDTTTRTRTVWQVRLLALDGAPLTVDCSSDLSEWTADLVAPTGAMMARAEPDQAAVDLCTPTAAGGFVGLENQLYRIQVHDLTVDKRPIVKWSRDNATVVTSWSKTAGADLTVGSIGPDAVLGFASDQWVELLDDGHELEDAPGTMVRLIKADGTTLTVDTASTTDSIDHDDFTVGSAKIRRWDSAPTITIDFDTWTTLELGVQVSFAPGTYRRGDYWLVPARTAIADVVWPRDSAGHPLSRPPAGVGHAYADLALVVSSGGTISVTDCRRRFPSLTTLTAGDVGFDDTVCALPGVSTVQEAIDRLCLEHDLRRHHRLLHGWGIVCGLEVHCGPDNGGPREHVSVLPGTAIDCNGNDLDLTAEASLDLIGMVDVLVQSDPTVLDGSGNGEVCLLLETDAELQLGFGLEKLDPAADRPPGLFEGTLLMDFYRDCIKKLRDWLAEELTPPPDEEGLPASPARQRVSALTNLLIQPLNRKSGRNVFLSPREDALLQDFYTGLRAQLQSETFCAMFANARVPEPYPASLAGIDTIFGVGSHSRIRIRPGGREAYTGGAGFNPLRPTGFLNRYDLERGVLVARIDPVAGADLSNTTTDSGTSAVTDVAFSRDGNQIYVTVPTRTESDTIFRVGDIVGDTIRWRPPITVCDVKLTSMATTAADPSHVYAVGLKKVTTTSGNSTTTSWHGAGIFQINPDSSEAITAPMNIPGLFPVGHIVIDATGRALVTTMAQDVPVTSGYNQLAVLSLPGVPGAAPTFVDLGATGNDDLGLVTLPGQSAVAYAALNTTGGKVVVGIRLSDASPVAGATFVQPSTGTMRLAGVGRFLVATSADEYTMRLLDGATAQIVDEYLLPLQVGPVSVATDPQQAGKTSRVYVLNQVSNTISVVDPKLIDPASRFDFAALAAYRKAMIEAYADLLAGFLQYLKDCLFDHFLVKCPTCTGDEKLYLACISIRDKQVYKVCNFSRRRYVKSFPTVGYWLSVVPIIPLLKEWLSKVACAVLPDYFSRLTVNDDSNANDRVSVQLLEQLISWAQSADVTSRFREVKSRNIAARNAVTAAISRGEQVAPPPAGPRLLSSDLVGQPVERATDVLTDRGASVTTEPFLPSIGLSAIRDLPGLVRTVQTGDQVTLYAQEGTVQWFTVDKPAPSAVAAPAATDVDERVAALERELADMRTQLQALTTARPARAAKKATGRTTKAE